MTETYKKIPLPYEVEVRSRFIDDIKHELRYITVFESSPVNLMREPHYNADVNIGEIRNINGYEGPSNKVS